MIGVVHLISGAGFPPAGASVSAKIPTSPFG